MLIRLAVTGLLFLSSAAHAAEWAAKDTALLASALTLQAIDWAQTRYTARNPNQFYEKNPILGESPSVGRVDKVCALAMLGTIGLSFALPQNYRRWFLGGVIVIEAAVVYDNYSVGARLDF